MHALRYILLLLCPMEVLAQPFAVDPGVTLSLTQRTPATEFAVLAEGRVAVSGLHDRVEGLARRGVVILGRDGRAAPGPELLCRSNTGNGVSYPCQGTLHATTDGGVILSGHFDHIAGLPIRAVAKLRSDGTVEPDFDPIGKHFRRRAVAAGVIVARGNIAYGLARDLDQQGSYTTEVFRIDLAAGRIDAAFALTGFPVSLHAIDAAGRVYAHYNGNLVRLDFARGGIDPDWSAGVAVAYDQIIHDDATDSLFALARLDLPYPYVKIVRIATNTAVGYDPLWSAELPFQPDTRWYRLLGGGDGTLLAYAGNGSDDYITPEYVVLRVNDGRIVGRRVVGYAGQGRALRMGDGWLTSDAGINSEEIVPNGSSVYRLDARLAVDPAFASDLRRSSFAYAAARATDGRIVLLGNFSRIDGQVRPAVARLQPSLALDPTWPAPNVSTGGFYTRTAVAINGAGDILIDEPHVGVWFMGLPPGVTVVDGDGMNSRRHYWGSIHTIRGGPGRSFYLVASGPLCGRSLFRSDASLLLATTLDPCPLDTTWTPQLTVGTSSATLEIADGAYFVAMPSPPASTIQLQRYALTADASPDPGWNVTVGAAIGEFPSVRTMAVRDDWVYLSGRFRSLNGVNVPALARVSRTGAQVDTNWTPAVAESLYAITVDDTHIYAIRPIGPSNQNYQRAFDVVRWSIARRGANPEVLATDGILDPRYGADIIALGDGRALVVGSFTRIGDYGRDGFAVVGSVDAVFAGGFESNGNLP